MKLESLNLGPKLRYLRISRQTYEKFFFGVFEATSTFSKLKVLCKNKNS